MSKQFMARYNKAAAALLLALVLVSAGCGKSDPAPAPAPSSAPAQESTSATGEQSQQPEEVKPLGSLRVNFSFSSLDQKSSNQVAIWIEDANGNYIDTVYATRFTAAGGHIKRPNSLPGWTAKSKWDSSNIELVHAVSQATPEEAGPNAVLWDCTDEKGQPVPAGSYAYLVETNIDGDNRVIWRGEFTVGGAESTTAATAEYLPEAASTMEAPVSGVEATFIPAA